VNRRSDFLKQAPELTNKLQELSELAKHSSLGNTIIDLVNIRASQLNGCALCLDMHSKEAKIHGERELRLYHVAIWRESPLFSEKEKAALEWTEAVTKLCRDELEDESYERLRKQFDEKQIAELTFAIGTINIWNRLCVPLRVPPGILDEAFGLTKAGLK
jgi:AhpD family alkylhydroperoxidase